MDRFRQKSKKDQQLKYVEKDKPNLSTSDVKSIRENLKIKEILRTVKMNSSMRIKAPRGSKIMQNKDFNENDDFDQTQNTGGTGGLEPPSATNPELIRNTELKCANETFNEHCVSDITETVSVDISNEPVIDDYNLGGSTKTECENETIKINDCDVDSSSSVPETMTINADAPSDQSNENDTSSEQSPVETSLALETSLPMEARSSLLAPIERPVKPVRERKLSLDQTMLNRRESFSQSELDLHSIGKSPLERKSSFFRKKMENFFKNTTEIFKKQALGSKSQLARRGSISVSLQSLNENTASTKETEPLQQDRAEQSSTMSLRSLDNSSQEEPDDQSDLDSFTGSQAVFINSQPTIQLMSSESIDSFNESLMQDPLLSPRAISMSSGLDTATGSQRRRISKANRVTWLASEGLTNYLRRMIQDEKNRETQVSHSYQDLSSIPENQLYGSDTDSKGRRLSYQRAVAGEDPVLPSRKRTLILENSEVSVLEFVQAPNIQAIIRFNCTN